MPGVNSYIVYGKPLGLGAGDLAPRTWDRGLESGELGPGARDWFQLVTCVSISSLPANMLKKWIQTALNRNALFFSLCHKIKVHGHRTKYTRSCTSPRHLTDRLRMPHMDISATCLFQIGEDNNNVKMCPSTLTNSICTGIYFAEFCKST